MAVSEHVEHWTKWYNKGDSNAQGYGIIICQQCNERLYCGKLPMSEEEVEEILKRLPEGRNNRTIQEIFLSLPPHTKTLDQTDLEKATANDMPNRTENEGTFVTPTLVVDTATKENHPSNGQPDNVAELTVTKIGASYSLTASFSRTVKDPTADFGSITCGLSLSETLPGEVSADDVRELAGDQFTVITAMVLRHLGLNFEQDEEGMIHEVFAGSRTVESSSRRAPAQSAPPARQASRGGSRPAQRSQPSSGPRRAARGNSQVPNTQALWYELVDNPGDWYWDQEKQNPKSPDFLSLIYFQDTGWPVGLWQVDARGNETFPDDDDWRERFNTMEDTEFAQEKPRRQST